MRSIEKIIIVLAVVVFITALGMGVLDVYVKGFEEGSDIFMELIKRSTNAIIALVALVAAVMTLGSSKRGRRKRK
ncbi:hypothetical protein LCGC14_1268460 [marine sediment metagenome]|uniref:Uncharacterized protein n=1 Tax=marine sediment metagenome TaxID=412755 RepID=A0A0F9KYX8_9ZZZZ|nr:hypothetical protein [Desulfobacterales bacterium]